MQLLEPTLTFAFEARVEIAESLRIGRGPGEEVWFTPITGGTVSGPRLSGVVLPYGGDWSTTRPTGTTLDARYLLRADDGAVIEIHNRGVFQSSKEVETRLVKGDPVAESEYYYRTSPVFQTDAESHSWLTSRVFVGMARDEAGVVCIRFFVLD
ncbi:DUF3237 domain-containing protein [Jatrophihabitans telluris]|uniref:UPF0311 protein M6D93_03170 n=1 Tax=Jatrophihabitans telluris TaxID=2038343 RepID=A0ABY4R093_9ACTN|nr:DUF3237 domain-containing protein [Jatrophihabitans telluris]UQX89008.1 DUF3237 domain-containing protein [Jatrophihabitans telluris]